MQFGFLSGSSRGFNLACFDWQQSSLSRLFHDKGVKSASDFLAVWESHIARNLDGSTGQFTPSSSSESAASRKRKLPQNTPHRSAPPSLRPAKIARLQQSKSMGKSMDEDAPTPGDFEEEIHRAFAGETIIK